MYNLNFLIFCEIFSNVAFLFLQELKKLKSTSERRLFRKQMKNHPLITVAMTYPDPYLRERSILAKSATNGALNMLMLPNMWPKSTKYHAAWLTSISSVPKALVSIPNRFLLNLLLS